MFLEISDSRLLKNSFVTVADRSEIAAQKILNSEKLKINTIKKRHPNVTYE